MLALLLALHGPAAPASADPIHYKLVNKSTVDMGMGGMAPIALTMSAFVSITLTDSAAGRIANVAIDSSTFDAGEMGAMMPPQMSESPNGVTLHAYFSNGKLVSMTASSANLQAMQLFPAVQLLMSGLHTAKPGDSWTDSTVADTTISTGTTKSSLVTAWKASSGASGPQYDGTVAGTTTVGSGPMQMDMQMTGTSHLNARAGQLPSTATSSASGSGNMNMGGQAIAMKLSTEVSAMLIP